MYNVLYNIVSVVITTSSADIIIAVIGYGDSYAGLIFSEPSLLMGEGEGTELPVRGRLRFFALRNISSVIVRFIRD